MGQKLQTVPTTQFGAVDADADLAFPVNGERRPESPGRGSASSEQLDILMEQIPRLSVAKTGTVQSLTTALQSWSRYGTSPTLSGDVELRGRRVHRAGKVGLGFQVRAVHGTVGIRS